MKKAPKPWTSIDDQLKLLKDRGLIIKDDKKAKRFIKNTGYYRLSGYFYSFRKKINNEQNKRSDEFIENSSFDDIKKLYLFDKKLRSLALDCLEHIEVSLRANLAYRLGKSHQNIYLDESLFNENFDYPKWKDDCEKLLEREKRLKNKSITHYLDNYDYVPIWVACDIWSFGTISKLCSGLNENNKKYIAQIYRLKSGKNLVSCLKAFNLIRNISAHHSRLWNASITSKASINGLKDCLKKLDRTKPFLYFCLMKIVLDAIYPESTWGNRFIKLLDEFPLVSNNAINLEEMGFLPEAREWDFWKDGL